MKKRHVNVPVFIPHLGCPNDCVFCNQRTISGVKEFCAEEVVPIIEEVLTTVSKDDYVEIAFFGGSFTGIDRDLMENLLNIANGYLKQGRIDSIRCSTRPDYINDDVLDILYRYGVRHIELGIQSASEDVLQAAKRGHGISDTKTACRLIKERGFTLGGQMMIGLPSASGCDEISTAELICSLGADEARIYPTIVFKATELCHMTESGEYTPLDIEEAVSRSADAFSVFVRNGVKVLRIGLCDSENLHSGSTYFAGPNHAAMGELVENEYYFRAICEKLDSINIESNSDLTVCVAKGHTSKVIGQHKKNKIRLCQKYGFRTFRVTESDDVSAYGVLLRISERI